MNKIFRNLHATDDHAGTICMPLAATRLQDKRQADKRCVKGRLYIIKFFFSISKSTSLTVLLTIQLMALGYLVWKMRWYYFDKATRKQILHALAASCMQCKAAIFLQARCENYYLNKKMKKPLKNLRIYATHVLNKCYPSTLCMARSNLIRRYL
jgi:hypothetical protein